MEFVIYVPWSEYLPERVFWRNALEKDHCVAGRAGIWRKGSQGKRTITKVLKQECAWFVRKRVKRPRWSESREGRGGLGEEVRERAGANDTGQVSVSTGAVA